MVGMAGDPASRVGEIRPAFQRYPEYKDSGVAWLGAVPTHWDIRRQRNVVDILVSNVDKHTVEGEQTIHLCNYVDVYKNDRITAAIPFSSATATAEEISRFKLLLGDVIITKDSESRDDIGVPAFVEYIAPDLLCGYHLAILRARAGILKGGYLFWIQQSLSVSTQYHLSANGVTRYGLSQNAIKNVMLLVPPLCEQEAIAAFLDRETAKIDALIAKQARLIALSQEKRQALISHAVTKGLDPHAPMKDSGVKWLGAIPAHWARKRLRFMAALNPSKQEARALPKDTEVSFLPMEAIGDDGSLNLSQTKTIAEVESGYTYFAEGDITLAKITPCFENGKGAITRGLTNGIGFGTTELTVLRPYLCTDSAYLYHLIMSQPFRMLGQGTMYGAGGQKRVPDDFVRNFDVAWPPYREQTAIAAFLDRETAKIDTLTAKAQQAIALLREHRTSLISAAVTGKIDVRAAG